MQGGLLLNVVISKCASILKLLAREDQTLLIRGDALLVLDLGLDHIDGVRGLHLSTCRQGPEMTVTVTFFITKIHSSAAHAREPVLASIRAHKVQV
jgi:hypothetical protein